MSESLFSKEFWPTPRSVARRMLGKVKNKAAKYFLDPEAGKGDLAEVIREPTTYEEWIDECDEPYKSRRLGSNFKSRSDYHVDAIELHPELCAVLRAKEFDVVGYDWLTYDGPSYYDVIMMNPPFSEGAAHLLKAWEFAHNTEIICLLNEQTLLNPHTEERRRLAAIIEQHGNVEYLGDCFSTAERKTDVRIAMVYLKKEEPSDEFEIWAATPGSEEKKPDGEFDVEHNMLAIRDNLGNKVQWYEMANLHMIKAMEHARKASAFMSQNRVRDPESDRSRPTSFKHLLAMAMDNGRTARSEFLRLHRRQAWTSVFEQMEFHRWLDSKQQESLLRDCQKDSVVPFTADNIRATLENVMAQRGKLFDQSVANVFDALTSHHAGNTNVKSEGWKTNDGYKVNERMVFPYGVHYDDKFGRGQFDAWRSYGQHAQAGTDLDRVLCVLDGESFAECHTVQQALKLSMESFNRGTDRSKTGDSQYFEFRFFQKGTLHLKWKRPDLLEQFNQRAAAGKKWIGENTQKQRPTKKEREAERDRDMHWECRVEEGHDFVDGVCSRKGCGTVYEPDPYAAIECGLCRAVAEETGEQCCPLHPKPMTPAVEAPAPGKELLLIEAAIAEAEDTHECPRCGNGSDSLPTDTPPVATRAIGTSLRMACPICNHEWLEVYKEEAVANQSI